MENQATPPPKYPLLEELLGLRHMTLQATYTVRDVAKLFGVSTRAIQERVAAGQINSRDLPGRCRFLSIDIEDFLRNSGRKGRR